ncbi:MAG: bifunctional sterol desaturase/short chain dehydrogenase [Synechococcales cyanobacterium K44_A2020_017]|nr:bifunctional sterol desaturase/short chain dehydrogenase [Synechococcales cyanobacterium K32_A2020_035]MBF2094754.1 bifunctional sterol desaturase/short chain dehydrogenase [Synechococcales cyanobacterium K44_A2020_017]
MNLFSLVFPVGLGLGSIVLAELVRDVYHVAGHYWPPLQSLHMLHHRAYRRDLSIANLDVYRRSQLYNDVPESLVMFAVTALGAWVSHQPAMLLGSLYALGFMAGAIARSQGYGMWTDLTHEPGDLTQIPSVWAVNRTYHWRHHFDQGNAYFSGYLTVVDKVLGTSLSLKGKVVAVTGASGSMGQSLIQELIRQGAKTIALTSSDRLTETDRMKVVSWQIGDEDQLRDRLKQVDILIINHGLNVHSDRTPEGVQASLEVNALSAWRLANVFMSTVNDSTDRATKELWINTSEAEVSPAFSPLYEISKRLIGDLITLRRLDAPCIIRKIVLGPFKSNLNPVGIMSPRWVARMVIFLAKRDVRTIIVTINPLTYLVFPLKEWGRSLYFRLFSRPAP